MVSDGENWNGGEENEPEDDLSFLVELLLTLCGGGVNGLSGRLVRAVEVDEAGRKRARHVAGDDHTCRGEKRKLWWRRREGGKEATNRV
jgi:hypothetical protein